ncbi:transmembrane protein 221 [Oncorhynchus mykiss]|uniref:Transmembrane protein 221 n=1 Tax=Oncorhynchus mykiss TaxID=8022 RepID=A0A8C7VR70_ONCMY|nr:transmembrane protein 221 [Oncorhynchus mykiss]
MTVYSQRSLMVLALLGILSGIMSLLSVNLIFHLQTQQIAVKESPPTISIVPTNVWAVLMPVSTVLSALSLTLNLSSVVVCLLHSYFTTEICRGEDDTERADWFLLDSRAVRHVAIGLFCLGVSVYLAAMSIYMLLVFEVETGIASACVLASGILILLMIVIHSLVKAARTAQHYRGGEHTDTLYQNQHGGSTPAARQGKLQDGEKPRRHRNNSQLHRHLSYPPPCTDPKQHHQHQYSPSHSPQSHSSDKEGYSSGGSGSRMHRTLSTESGLLQSPSKPWNGINNEMRSVLARKSGASSKDSTLV